MSESNLPANIGISADDFLKAAQDNEQFDQKDQIIPFIRILQPLSPQAQEGNTSYTPGAKAGMFWNASSNTLVDGTKGIYIIPLAHRYNYVEWVQRSEGGGLVKNWGDSEEWKSLCLPAEQIAYQPKTRDGHVIAISRHFYVFQIDLATAETETGIMPFATTSLKVAKAWSSMMMGAPKIRVENKAVTPPYHYYLYHFTTERVTNAKGTWYLPKIRHHIVDNKYQTIFDLPHGKLLWTMADDFKQSLREGNVKTESQGNDTNTINGSATKEDDDTF